LGQKLGTLEDEKARLPSSASGQGPGAGMTLLAARNQWVRVVNAFVANGELAELDEETAKLIFGPLRAAEKAADRRDRGGGAKAPQGGRLTASAQPRLASAGGTSEAGTGTTGAKTAAKGDGKGTE